MLRIRSNAITCVAIYLANNLRVGSEIDTKFIARLKFLSFDLCDLF